MSGQPAPCLAADVLVGTNSPRDMLTHFLSWWLKSGLMLTMLLIHPGEALPVSLAARHRRPTLQLSPVVYPLIDHALKVVRFRWVDVCGCVCVRESQRRGVLSCQNETEYISRSRQFLLCLAPCMKKEAGVSVFLGIQVPVISGS